MLAFVKKYSGLTSAQIRADAGWQMAASKKPKHFDQMSEGEIDAFKKLLDAKFPPNMTIMANAVTARY